MDDRIRISDADRERVADRLRDHFAEGRLTADELDERLTAALSAKTFGDLRVVMTDLPDPGPAPLLTKSAPARAGRSAIAAYRRPRLLPLVLLGLLAAVLIPGIGWLFVTVLKIFLVAWLAVCVAGIVIASRFRKRLRRDRAAGHYHRHQHWQGSHWHGGGWPGGGWPGGGWPGGGWPGGH
jgi:uncharacterized membrane protein YgcG